MQALLGFLVLGDASRLSGVNQNKEEEEEEEASSSSLEKKLYTLQTS